MRSEQGVVSGDVTVVDDFRLHGVVTGDHFVENASTLYLHGIVGGSVWVAPRCTAFIYGVIGNDLTNQGGILHLFGVVRGRVFGASGETLIDPGALVLGHSA